MPKLGHSKINEQKYDLAKKGHGNAILVGYHLTFSWEWSRRIFRWVTV